MIGLRVNETDLLIAKPSGQAKNSGKIPALSGRGTDEMNFTTGPTQFLAHHAEISQAEEDRLKGCRKVTRNDRGKILGPSDGHADERIRDPQWTLAQEKPALLGSAINIWSTTAAGIPLSPNDCAIL
jgi:hypothetical protein